MSEPLYRDLYVTGAALNAAGAATVIDGVEHVAVTQTVRVPLDQAQDNFQQLHLLVEARRRDVAAAGASAPAPRLTTAEMMKRLVRMAPQLELAPQMRAQLEVWQNNRQALSRLTSHAQRSRFLRLCDALGQKILGQLLPVQKLRLDPGAQYFPANQQAVSASLHPPAWFSRGQTRPFMRYQALRAVTPSLTPVPVPDSLNKRALVPERPVDPEVRPSLKTGDTVTRRAPLPPNVLDMADYAHLRRPSSRHRLATFPSPTQG